MSSPPPSSIATVIDPRTRDLGGLAVGRVLPSSAKRAVGPFLFFDHFGPVNFQKGQGMDVRPHPHIHLATVTYLFEGEIVHRDSLGSRQTIHPSDINWMTAGRGIVHSERTAPEVRAHNARLHGIQLWVGLPQANEDTEPEFHHHPGGTLPAFERDGARVRVLAGSGFGKQSPVRTYSPLLYADVALDSGAIFALPNDYEERAVYLVEGALLVDGVRYEAPRMLVFTRGASVEIEAASAARLVLLSGEPLDGPRHIEWNFVSSSRERIVQAKRDWKAGKFPLVPGDEVDFIPLPE